MTIWFLASRLRQTAPWIIWAEGIESSSPGLPSLRGYLVVVALSYRIFWLTNPEGLNQDTLLVRPKCVRRHFDSTTNLPKIRYSPANKRGPPTACGYGY